MKGPEIQLRTANTPNSEVVRDPTRSLVPNWRLRVFRASLSKASENYTQDLLCEPYLGR